MSDRPVVMSTSFGPIGAIISLPEGETRAAGMLLKGAGPARFGRNSKQARIARMLAEEGVAVLRMDYPGQGDSSAARGDPDDPVPAIREVLEWYRQWIGRRDPVLMGPCYGGRLAVSVAAQERELGGVAVVVPYPWAVHGGTARTAIRTMAANRLGVRRPDRRLVAELASVAGRVPARIIAGEADEFLPALRVVAGRVPAVSLEIVPGIALRGGVPGGRVVYADRLARFILTSVPAPAGR